MISAKLFTSPRRPLESIAAMSPPLATRAFSFFSITELNTASTNLKGSIIAKVVKIGKLNPPCKRA